MTVGFWRGWLLATLLTTALAAPASAAPQWGVSVNQGTVQAAVTGSGGTDLYVICTAGTAEPTAALFFVPPQPFAGEVGQYYPVVFKVDEQKMTLLMALVEPAFLAYPVGEDTLLFAALETLTRQLIDGKALAIEATDLTWREDYSLKGSGKALKGIFEGCEP